MIGLEVHYGEFSESEIDMLANIASEFDLVPLRGATTTHPASPERSSPRGRPTHEYGRGPAREEGCGKGAMTITAAAFIIGAYLLGAIPSSYLVARWLKGVDIRGVRLRQRRSVSTSASTSGAWGGRLRGRLRHHRQGDLAHPPRTVLRPESHRPSRRRVGRRAGTQLVSLPSDDGRTGHLDGYRHLGRVPHVAGDAHRGRRHRIVGGLWLKDLGFWTFAMIVALPGLVYLVGFFDLFDRDMDARHPLRLRGDRAAGKATDRQLGAT